MLYIFKQLLKTSNNVNTVMLNKHLYLTCLNFITNCQFSHWNWCSVFKRNSCPWMENMFCLCTYSRHIYGWRSNHSRPLRTQHHQCRPTENHRKHLYLPPARTLRRFHLNNKKSNILSSWHNGSAFVFCSCRCTFESEPSPTSAHACGEVTGCAPAAKRSASVAPEVNLGECTLHSPLQKNSE